MTGGAFQFLVSRGENKEGSLSNENVEREGRPSAPLPRPPSPWPYPGRLRLKRGELPARQCASPASPLHVLSAALASHDYILKIVPTVYEDKSGKQQYSYQYTVANKVRAIAPSAGREQRRQASGPDFHWCPSRGLSRGAALARLCPWVKMGGQSQSQGAEV